MLTRGTYVIMNDCDCPEARMVAVLTRYDDRKGVWHALYLATYTNMAAPYGPQPTPLSAFGMRVEWKWHEYRVVSTGEPCTATYRDGVPRKCQDCFGEDRWWFARAQAFQACEAFAARARLLEAKRT
jgi:hypothetical protein